MEKVYYIENSSDSEDYTKGKVKKGYRHGLWETYEETPKLKIKWQYDKGELVSAIAIDSLGNKADYYHDQYLKYRKEINKLVIEYVEKRLMPFDTEITYYSVAYFSVDQKGTVTLNTISNTLPSEFRQNIEQAFEGFQLPPFDFFSNTLAIGASNYRLPITFRVNKSVERKQKRKKRKKAKNKR